MVRDIDFGLGVTAARATQAVGVTREEVLKRRPTAAGAEGEVALSLVGGVLVLLFEGEEQATLQVVTADAPRELSVNV